MRNVANLDHSFCAGRASGLSAMTAPGWEWDSETACFVPLHLSSR
jgi:hypothetical protein